MHTHARLLSASQTIGMTSAAIANKTVQLIEARLLFSTAADDAGGDAVLPLPPWTTPG